MKWVTTDYKGDKKVWYSEDVIKKIREIAIRAVIDRRNAVIFQPTTYTTKPDFCEAILDFLNEVDND